MTSPGKLRIAFSSRSPLAGELHPECLAALEDAMNLLSELGHELHEITLDIDGGAWKRASTLMMCGICAADVRDAERRVGRTAVRRDFDRSTWLSRAVGESLTAGEYAHAVRTLERLGMQIAVALAGYDLWLTPTLGRPPLSLGALHPKGLAARAEELAARLQLGALARRSSEFEAFADRVFAFMPFTQLANAAGLPSMNVPLWWNPEGVPIGVMFTGRFGDEATLLRIAGQLEEARPWAHRKPPVL